MCDENKKINKDFRCEQGVLLHEMKYFEKYIKGANSLDDIDISVHCDINIFEWLMRYLGQIPNKDDGAFKAPGLEVNNVISILISSDFLQMPRLVDDCLRFVRDHVKEVVNLPIHMNCLNSYLLKRLAGLIDVSAALTARSRSSTPSTKSARTSSSRSCT